MDKADEILGDLDKYKESEDLVDYEN